MQYLSFTDLERGGFGEIRDWRDHDRQFFVGERYFFSLILFPLSRYQAFLAETVLTCWRPSLKHWKKLPARYRNRSTKNSREGIILYIAEK
jgi:hypothetical protein